MYKFIVIISNLGSIDRNLQCKWNKSLKDKWLNQFQDQVAWDWSLLFKILTKA